MHSNWITLKLQTPILSAKCQVIQGHLCLTVIRTLKKMLRIFTGQFPIYMVMRRGYLYSLAPSFFC